jgi:hypothetical protein
MRNARIDAEDFRSEELISLDEYVRYLLKQDSVDSDDSDVHMNEESTANTPKTNSEISGHAGLNEKENENKLDNLKDNPDIGENDLDNEKNGPNKTALDNPKTDLGDGETATEDEKKPDYVKKREKVKTKELPVLTAI